MEFQSIILFKHIFIIYKKTYLYWNLKSAPLQSRFPQQSCNILFTSYTNLLHISYSNLIQILYKHSNRFPKKMHNVSFFKLESPDWSERNLIHSWKFLHFCFRRRAIKFSFHSETASMTSDDTFIALSRFLFNI